MHPIILHESCLTEEAIKKNQIGETLGDDDLNQAIKAVSSCFPALARRVGARLCMLTTPANSGDADESEAHDIVQRHPH